LESLAAEMRRLQERLENIENLMELCDARNAGKSGMQYSDDDHRNSRLQRGHAMSSR
jgi:hypothetical protein